MQLKYYFKQVFILNTFKLKTFNYYFRNNRLLFENVMHSGGVKNKFFRRKGSLESVYGG